MTHYNYGNTNGAYKQFHHSESVPNVTKRLVEMLDHVEERVELLREHASAVESERDSLLNILASIRSNKDLKYIGEGEKEEIEITAQRLLHRTLTVEVTVTTPRSELQKKALNNINKMYDELLVILKSDLTNARVISQQYMNACLSEYQGPINQKFQAAILECTADDQKGIRKRLETLMSSLPRYS